MSMKKTNLLHQRYRNKSPLTSYFRLYRDYRGRMFVTFLLFVVKCSPVWAMPIITANIINILSREDGDAAVPAILTQAAIGAVLITQNQFSHVYFVRMLSYISRNIEKNLRGALCQRLQQLSISYHTAKKLGTLHTKVLRDVENIEGMTKTLFESMLQMIFSFSIAVTVTAIRVPKFLIFYLVTIPIAVIIYRVVRKELRARNERFRMSIEDMSGRVVEMLRLIPITRAHNLETDELDKMDEKLDTVKSNGLKLDMVSGIFGALNWVVFTLFNLLTLTTASILSYKKIVDIKIGDVVLLTTYFNSISGSIMGMMNVLPAFAKGIESVKSVGEVLECPDIERNAGRKKITSINGKFTFDNVCFKYPDQDSHAIDHVSLKVEAGETIAFVGPSGSGKSTMMSLLIGFIRPDDGTLMIDQYDVDTIDLRSYRQFISVVTQETVLFDGSVRDNVVYGRNEASDEAIAAAIADANLTDFVNSLPEGIDTQIRENGGRLSGGQKQRLAIARALLRNPKVLILDEATSALDVESEALIQEALERLIQGRTTFIVAHRLSTIRNADRIVVMDKGKIVEIGTHEELLKLEGIYYNMIQLQSNA